MPNSTPARAISRAAWYVAMNVLANTEDKLLTVRIFVTDRLPAGTLVDRVVETILNRVEYVVHEAWFVAGLAWEARLPPARPGYRHLFATLAWERTAHRTTSGSGASVDPLPLRCPYRGCGDGLLIGTDYHGRDDQTHYVECLNTACRAEWDSTGEVREASHLTEPAHRTA